MQPVVRGESTVKRAQRHAALARMLEGMRRGQPWREAAREAGLTVSRATAYRLLRRRRMEGETALHDRRQGHPYVLRAPVRHWLQAYCRAHPTHSGRLIQAVLSEHDGLTVSVSQINRVRSTLGLSRRTHCAERTHIRPTQARPEGNHR